MSYFGYDAGPDREAVRPLAAARQWAPTLAFGGVRIAACPRLNALLALNEDAALIWDALCQHADPVLAAEAYRSHSGCGADEAVRRVSACTQGWAEAGLLEPPETAVVLARPSAGAPERWWLEETYAIFGARVRIRVGDPRPVAVIADLLAPAVAGTDAYDRALDLVPEGAGYALVEDGVVVREAVGASDAHVALINRLLHMPSTVPRRDRLALLHAACVTSRDATILLVAPRGSGKSTLAASLVAHGWRLVADDITPLLAPDARAEPLPFAMSIKEGSWPVLGPGFHGLGGARTHRMGGRVLRYLTLDPGCRAAEPARPTVILFPSYAAGRSSGRLVSVTPLESLERLAEESWINLEPEMLRRFLGWLSLTPSAAIAYDSRSQALHLVEEAIGQARVD